MSRTKSDPETSSGDEQADAHQSRESGPTVESADADPLAQPHDAFFKWVFSQREHAIGLLKAALPGVLCAAIDWSTLRLEAGSFVDRALRGRHSDLALSARLGEGRVVFYSLLEQQRRPEDLMPFRFGVYMMRLWERLVRNQPTLKKIPPIVPILIHHSTSGWKAATAFQDIVDMTGADDAVRAALLPHVPCFELKLIDVSRGRADSLVDEALTALGRVALWCMSVAGDDARLAREIGQLAAALDEVLRAPNGLAALEVLLRYLAATHVRLSAEKVGKLLKKAVGPRAEEAVVTFLDEIELRGQAKGQAQGRAQGRAETLLDLFAARFGSVPADVRARLMTADEASLSRWTLRVLSAQTLADVFSENGTKAPPAKRAPARKRARRA